MAIVPGDKDHNKWPAVTRDRRCPKCDKPNRCRLSPDGMAGICWRSGTKEVWHDDKPAGGNGQYRRPDPKPTKPPPTFINAAAATAAASKWCKGTPAGSWNYPGGDFIVARFNLGDGSKQFFPMHKTAAGPWMIADPPGPLPLYRGDEFPAAEPVYVCEGEKATDCARSVGLPAVTSAHGSNAADKSDWTPLAGRDVIILPDNDDAGEKYAGDVVAILSELKPPARVKIVRLPGLPPGGDIVEFDANIGGEPSATKDAIEKLASTIPWIDSTATGTGAASETPQRPTARPRRQPTADQLIEMVRDGCELWRDPSYRAFATVGRDNFPIRSAQFQRWLTGEFYRMTGGAAARDAMQSAIEAAEAIAVHDATSGFHESCIRIGHVGNVGYLDLADELRTVIQFDAAGWNVAEKPPVKFLRPAGMLTLPTPTVGGDMDQLRALLNIPNDAAWMLFSGLALAPFQRDGTRPAGAFSGENGSGKTFAAYCLKYCTDPTKGGLRQPPKDASDLLICALNNRLVALDNISHLPDDLADQICRLCSGAGLGKRTLYTNDGETIIDVCRPVILTSIPSLLGREDLADRAIDLYFPPIPDERRRDERQLLSELERIRPAILGSLLEAAGAGLAGAEAVALDAMPRLADFTKFAEAAGVTVWGWTPGHFAQSFIANRSRAAAGAIERSTVGELIVKLLDRTGLWEGTPTALYDAVEALADEKIRRRKDWPGSPDALSTRLRRLAPQLRKLGIDVDSGREATSQRRRLITIHRI